MKKVIVNYYFQFLSVHISENKWFQYLFDVKFTKR